MVRRNECRQPGQGAARSTDNGGSWTPRFVAPNPGDLADKNHLWVDNNASSPYKNRLYSAWTDLAEGAPTDGEVVLSRSVDNGDTWSSKINISQGIALLSQGVNIQVGPNGEVYAAWAIYDVFPSDETAVGFAKSTNGGQTFGTPVRPITNIRGIRYSRSSKDMRVNSFPVMAVDISGGPNNGNIYIVWANIGVPGQNQGPDIDIYMIRSTDGGNNWSSPIRVNQDPTGNGNEHFLPWITCDPETGALSVVFYDDRNVFYSTDVETFVAVSFDGGTTWDDFKVSDVSFTPSPIPGFRLGYFGDYLGISARGQQVYPVWTDNRSGRALAYVSPFTTLPPDLILQNQTIAASRVYQAGQSIIAGPAYTVGGGSDVSLRAGDRIELKPGFTAELGSQFRAEIDPGLNLQMAIASLRQGNAVESVSTLLGSTGPNEKSGLNDGNRTLEDDTSPQEFALFPNYPNPFNPATTIRYALKQDVTVTIKVYNILAQEVRTLVNGFQTAGFKSVAWDGRDNAGTPVSSGSYIYRIEAGDFAQSQAMVLMR